MKIGLEKRTAQEPKYCLIIIINDDICLPLYMLFILCIAHSFLLSATEVRILKLKGKHCIFFFSLPNGEKFLAGGEAVSQHWK
jgi:hypothetical protein